MRAYDAVARCAVSLVMLSAFAGPPAWAGTSTQPSPSVVFSTPGTKAVSLTACAGTFCDSLSQNVVVLDPMPAVTSAVVQVASVEAGQMARLDGAGTGKPPLNYSWQVTSLAAPAFSLPGSSVWWDTTGKAPGVYTLVLSISNAAGNVVSTPLTVTLLPPQAADFFTIQPCRAYDSRSGLRLASGSARTLNVASACGVPADARAVAINVTVVNPTDAGNATLFPGNYPQPATSTINFVPGTNRANSAVMPLSTDGQGTLGVAVSIANSGSADVVVDVSGYFQVPSPTL